MVFTYGVLSWIGSSAPLALRALGKPLQQVGGAVRTGFIDHLIQRFHPFRGLLWIEIDYPLVQFLVHGYFYYTWRWPRTLDEPA